MFSFTPLLPCFIFLLLVLVVAVTLWRKVGERKLIAAYVEGYPLVLLQVTKEYNLATTLTPVNKFFSVREFPTPEFKSVVSPNRQTLYSSAFLDLSAGPLVLHIPAVPDDRYFLVTLLDENTNVFFNPGSRTTGNGAQDYLLDHGLGARSKKPVDQVVVAPSSFVWVIVRIECLSEKDYPVVHKIQDGFSLTPLDPERVVTKVSQLNDVSTDLAGRLTTTSPPEIVASMSLEEFFRRAGKSDGDNINRWSTTKQTQLARRAEKVIRDHFETMGTASPLVNNWHVITDPTRIGTYDHHYLDRASVAMEVLGANLPADSIYPYTSVDLAGHRLDSKNNYLVKFVGGEPPCGAFWSLTLYNDQNYLVENAAKIYSIGKRTSAPRVDPSPSLETENSTMRTIIISRETPVNEEGKTSLENWLPSGNPGAEPENFNLILRIYWPLAPVLESRWRYPVVMKEGTNEGNLRFPLPLPYPPFGKVRRVRE